MALCTDDYRIDDLVRKAKSYGNNDFVPQEITRVKKEQIIKQFNNMNEKSIGG